MFACRPLLNDHLAKGLEQLQRKAVVFGLVLVQQFDQLYVIRADASGTHQFAGVGVDRVLLPHELEQQAVAHADSVQLLVRVHQKMCHEVMKRFADVEANEAQVFQSDHEVSDVEVFQREFSVGDALMTEQYFAVFALDVLSCVAFNPAEHELDPLVYHEMPARSEIPFE